MSEEEIIKKAEYIIKNGKAYQGSITEYFVELYYLFNKEKEKNKELEKKLDEISDEERKAIERVEQFIDGERQYNTKTGETIIPYEYGESQRFVYKETYYAIQVVLNLIEKQSKEIEELKKQDLSNSKIIANMSTRHFNDREKIRKYEALQDKIKAKIEELNEKSFKNDINYTEFYYKKEVLQSLLEEDK